MNKRQNIRIISSNKIILIILILFSISKKSDAQDIPKYKMEEIVVTGSKTPTTFSELTRSVTIITKNDIEKAPVNSVQELLQFVIGADLNQRGINGIQGDIGIRGGTFEESLILIDGIKVNDPQTGHHNLNLPVALNNIERIEILKGQGSGIYGPDAFGGVINIVTKNEDRNNLSLKTEGGQNGYYSGEFYGSLILNKFANHISISKQKSDGYTHNTDFDLINYTYGSSLSLQNWNINFLLGYNDKKFGANSFYSIKFPNQWEHTTTKFSNLRASFGDSLINFISKIYWRQNDDYYLLDYEVPEFYRNIHQTNIYGAEIQSSLTTLLGVTTFGGEFSKDQITSTALGEHSRDNFGIFAEEKLSPTGDLIFLGSAYLYNYATIGWKFWPDFSIGYNLSESWRAYGSFGKSFRVPTYTELYYSSPASIGNSNLLPEESTNYEVGLRYTEDIFYSQLSLFLREGENLIDWARSSVDEPWKSQNILSLNTTGIEFSMNIYPKIAFNDLPIDQINISYSYTYSRKQGGNYQSQYLFNYPRNQIIAALTNEWFYGIKQQWNFQFEDITDRDDKYLINTQLMKSIGNIEIYLKARNLLNKSYQEIDGVPLPGRLLYAGIKYDL